MLKRLPVLDKKKQVLQKHEIVNTKHYTEKLQSIYFLCEFYFCFDCYRFLFLVLTTVHVDKLEDNVIQKAHLKHTYCILIKQYIELHID